MANDQKEISAQHKRETKTDHIKETYEVYCWKYDIGFTAKSRK